MPDTHWCHQFFMMERLSIAGTPDGFAIGCQPQFATRLVKDGMHKSRAIFVLPSAQTDILVLRVVGAKSLGVRIDDSFFYCHVMCRLLVWNTCFWPSHKKTALFITSTSPRVFENKRVASVPCWLMGKPGMWKLSSECFPDRYIFYESREIMPGTELP